MGLESFLVLRVGSARASLREQSLALSLVESLRPRAHDGMVRRRCAESFELPAAPRHGPDETHMVSDLAIADTLEARQLRRPSRRGDPEQGVGSKARDDALAE